MIGAYVRVSTQEQARRENPADSQLAGIRDYCVENELSPVKVFEDLGLSGTDCRRPGLLAAMHAIRSGEIESIVAWDPSRIARDTMYFGWVRHEITAAGGNILFVHGDTTPLEVDIRAALAAERVRELRRDSRRGVRHNLSLAKRHGAALYGFAWLSKTERGIVEPEAEVVRKIFDLYDPAGGDSQPTEIARQVGWPHKKRIFDVLRHPGYAGAHVYNRSKVAVSRRRETIPRADWVILWDSHPAIVTREQFERIQGKLDRTAHLSFGSRGTIALSGLLRCMDCRRRLRSSGWKDTRRGRAFRYICPECNRRAVVKGWTQEIVKHVLAAVVNSEFPAHLIADIAKRDDPTNAKKAKISRRIKQLERSEENLLRVIAAAKDIRPEKFVAKIEGIQAEQAQLTSELAAVQPTMGLSASTVRRQLRTMATCLDGVQAANIDYSARPVLQRWVDRIEVNLADERAKLRVHLRIGDLWSPQPWRSSS